MNKNIIFGGVVVGALAVAAIVSSFSDERQGSGYSIRVSSDDDNHRYGYGNSNLSFKGKDIECKAGETVELTHEDGSKTTVQCE